MISKHFCRISSLLLHKTFSDYSLSLITQRLRIFQNLVQVNIRTTAPLLGALIVFPFLLFLFLSFNSVARSVSKLHLFLGVGFVSWPLACLCWALSVLGWALLPLSFALRVNQNIVFWSCPSTHASSRLPSSQLTNWPTLEGLRLENLQPFISNSWSPLHPPKRVCQMYW